MGSSPPGTSGKVSIATAWTPSTRSGRAASVVNSIPGGGVTAGTARPARLEADRLGTLEFREATMGQELDGFRAILGAAEIELGLAARPRDRRDVAQQALADAGPARRGQHADHRPQRRVFGAEHVDPAHRGGAHRVVRSTSARKRTVPG